MVQRVTLPVEFDAAAWTYVAAALISLIDVTRWIRVLR